MPVKIWILEKLSFFFSVVFITVAVINATWYEGQYLFSLALGFGLEGSQSDGRAFTFYILQVSKGHTGMYSCRPKGYHDGDIKGCELVLNKSIYIFLHLILNKSSIVWNLHLQENVFFLIMKSKELKCLVKKKLYCNIEKQFHY